MSSGNQYERLFKLWATVSKLVVDGKRSIGRVIDALQQIVDEARSWKLDLHPTQEDGEVIQGWDLEKYYDGPEFKGRHYSLESPEVKGWIRDPTTYPDEFKGKAVFLWESRRWFSGFRKVACLAWDGRHVGVRWCWLGHGWHRLGPALLASNSKQSEARLEQAIP